MHELFWLSTATQGSYTCDVENKRIPLLALIQMVIQQAAFTKHVFVRAIVCMHI